MATNVEELTGGAPEDGEQSGAAEQRPEQHEQEAEAGGGQSLTVEDLAADMGWTPKDKWTGPPEQWKPADAFIRDGREIQRSTARELRDLRSTLDVMSRTTADIMADRLEAQRRELTERYNQQVDEGDAAEAFKTSQELLRLEQRAAQPIRQPSTAGQEFAQRHASWFNKDPVATQRAVDICNDLAAKGFDQEAQLRAAERTVRAEYPEYFKDEANGTTQRTPPTVARPGGHRGGPTNGTKRGYADMPAEARKVADGMVERGLIPNREAYSERYWQMMKGEQ